MARADPAHLSQAVWSPILPYLPADVRFLAYNQRSYAGSSPAFVAQKAGGTDATAAYLLDLLDFLTFVVRDLGCQEAKRGGIVLLGWSKGTVLPLSLLSATSPATPTSFTSSLPGDLLGSYPVLGSHLRSILLFEPPGSALGRAPTSDYTTAMAAVSPPNSSTAEEFAEAFAGWIASYSDPTHPSQPPTSSLAPSELSDIERAVGGEGAWQAECVAGGFAWRLAEGGAEVASLAEGALTQGRWPVGLIYGARTNGYCLDAAKTIQGWWKDRPQGEESGRVGVRSLEETNHFAFVHRPKEFVEAVVGLIGELGW